MIKSLLNRILKPSGLEQVTAPRLPDGVRIYAFGDVHGRVDLLDKLYGQVANDREERPVDKAMEVFLGDYVDRGPRSKDVLDWLLTGSNLADKRICLRGNHELMMQAFLDDSSVIGSWGQYGGLETLYSYGLKFKLPIAEEAHEEIQAQLRDALPAAHLEFLKSLRPSASAGGYFFAHAGVNPTVPLSEQGGDDLYWIREPFLNWNRPLEKIVVHGHTPVEQPEVEVHRIGVDTGAYVTGRLTCVVLEGGDVRFLST